MADGLYFFNVCETRNEVQIQRTDKHGCARRMKVLISDASDDAMVVNDVNVGVSTG